MQEQRTGFLGTRRVSLIAKERTVNGEEESPKPSNTAHPPRPIPNPNTLMEICFDSQCLLQVKVTLSSFRLLLAVLAAVFLTHTLWDREALEGLY